MISQLLGDGKLNLGNSEQEQYMEIYHELMDSLKRRMIKLPHKPINKLPEEERKSMEKFIYTTTSSSLNNFPIRPKELTELLALFFVDFGLEPGITSLDLEETIDNPYVLVQFKGIPIIGVGITSREYLDNICYEVHSRDQFVSFKREPTPKTDEELRKVARVHSVMYVHLGEPLSPGDRGVYVEDAFRDLKGGGWNLSIVPGSETGFSKSDVMVHREECLIRHIELDEEIVYSFFPAISLKILPEHMEMSGDNKPPLVRLRTGYTASCYIKEEVSREKFVPLATVQQETEQFIERVSRGLTDEKISEFKKLALKEYLTELSDRVVSLI